MNKEIILKVDEIIDIIEKSTEYQKYLVLQKQIKEDKKLFALINKVRVLQKDYVHNLLKKDELDKYVNELNDYPLYREYSNTLYEINNIYGIIESALNNYFSNKLN